ncbi:DapH/DapD/GlmU-related protein [Vibrio pelagius]|uniref:acyltransferase n=1 Tax=Vibrio pelagius TaxID=28169 RepID=UPI0035513295
MRLFSNYTRKSKSFIILVVRKIRTKIKKQFYLFFNDGLRIDGHVHFGSNLFISTTDDGVIEIYDDVYISDNVRIIAKSGKIKISSGTFIGPGVVIVAHNSIYIGENSLIAEYCTIRDQSHILDKGIIKEAGMAVEAINIGSDTWIGAKATILKGVTVGDAAVIGANSVVNRSMDGGKIYAGSPAKFIKERIVE